MVRARARITATNMLPTLKSGSRSSASGQQSELVTHRRIRREEALAVARPGQALPLLSIMEAAAKLTANQTRYIGTSTSLSR
jgi:hypothetical protein